MKEFILATRVGRKLYHDVQLIILIQEINVSEYLRRLIEADVDSKTLVVDEELRLALLKAIKESGGNENNRL